MTKKYKGFLEERRCARCGKSEEYVYLDPHHTIKQSRGGNDNDVIWLCRRCHEWTESHVKEARKLGLDIEGYKIIRH